MHGNFRIGMRIAVVCLFCVVVLLLVNQWRLDHEWATAVELQKSTAPNGETRMVKTVDGVEYAFRWCPPGKFKMGRPFSKLESPQHEVTLTNGFWMLETEVTQAMWKSVMGEKLDDHKGSKFPVEQVNWYTCLTFCRKLSSKIGMPILFPTEAQWEYACRAGTTGPYAGRPHAMGWFKSNSGGTSHPVGQKKPNAWGLYDMHGNVSEWCFDRFGCCYPRGSVTDPVISEEPYTSSHVFRGGSWNDEAKYGTSTIRDSISPDSLSDSGFRVVSLIDAGGKRTRMAKTRRTSRSKAKRDGTQWRNTAGKNRGRRGVRFPLVSAGKVPDAAQ